MTKRLKIAVLYGGKSAEREVSLKSGAVIAKGLIQKGFDTLLFDTKHHQLTELNDQKVDIAFIALHGRGGEDGCIQGALEYLNIPYTGSNVLGSALSMDKIRSKQIWQALNLPTASFDMVDKRYYQCNDAENILSALGGTVMVKPTNEGSSIGMAKVSSTAQLQQALENAFVYDQQVLIESWISGPEYTIAILGDQALPVIHMETPHEFYDYEAKYQSTSTQYHCPCHLSVEDENALKALSLKAFNATGASGWGRVDVMRDLTICDTKEQWQLLEVNTVPGMTETSLVPKAAQVYGLSFEQLVTKIIMLAIKDERLSDKNDH